MNGSVGTIYRPFLRVAIIAAALSLLLACGQAEAPTPTVAPAATATPTVAPAATATPTKAVVATPTPTTVGPVATPTPTLVATPTSGPAAEKPRSGGTMNFVMNNVALNFDYQGTGSGHDRSYNLGKFYNGLLINYEGKKVECDLCSEWHLENEGKTVVITLIRGAKFHNGKEITSEDVKYSIRMLVGDVDGLPSVRAGSLKEYLVSVEAPSRYEVRLNIIHPTSYVPQLLGVANSVIYPAGTTRDDLKKAPAGSGPYLITKHVPGSTFELEKNPNYFKPGQPYIDNMKMVLVVDTGTRVASFLAHKVEYIGGYRPPEQYMPQYYKLKNEGKLSSYQFLTGSRVEGVFMSNPKPPFNNLKMRQVVNLTVDRKAYGDAMLEGEYRGAVLTYREADGEYGRPENQVWDVLPGWGTGAKKQQEIEQAKQLLKDAGYPNGLDITFLTYGTSSAGYISESELFQQQLTNVGLRTKIEVLPTQDAFIARQLATDYQLLFYPYSLTTATPEEVIGGFWLTAGARAGTGYSNPEVDKLYGQMAQETDPAKKVALFKQIEQFIVFKDQAWAPMPSDIPEQFWWKRLGGMTWGITLSPWANSGVARADRLWLKD